MTQDEILQQLRLAAKNKGANPDSWSPLSVPSVIFWCLAYLLAQLYVLVDTLTAAIAVTENNPDLDTRLYSLFAERRLPPISAEYEVAITNSNPTPVTVVGYKLISTTGVSLTIASVTVAGLSTVTSKAVADVPGVSGNVTLSELSSDSYVTNVSVTVSSQSVVGKDSETNAEYILRCQKKWGGLGAGSSEFYANLVNELDSSLTKVITRSQPDGVLWVYCAQSAAACSEEQAALVTEMLTNTGACQGLTPLAVVPTVFDVNVEAVIHCKPGTAASVDSDIQKSLELWQSRLNYGDGIKKSDFYRYLLASPSVLWIEGEFEDISVPEFELSVIQATLSFEES